MSHSGEVLVHSGVSAPKEVLDPDAGPPVVSDGDDLFSDLTVSEKAADAFEHFDEKPEPVHDALPVDGRKENGEIEVRGDGAGNLVDEGREIVANETVMAKTLINGLLDREKLDRPKSPSADLRSTPQGDADALESATSNDASVLGVANHLSSNLEDQNVGKMKSPKKTDVNNVEVSRPRREENSVLAPSGRPADVPDNYPNRTASGTSSIVGDVLYSIASEDEEGRSRQRILAFAAKRYSTAVERNPQDHDALYNWALVLQESADNTGPEIGNSGKDSLLEEACRKYEAATHLCPTLHEAFYNWAIAISDRAKIRGRTKEAEDLWKQACERYDRSVQLNWNSPQALNNWGLALQELGGIVPIKDRRAIVKKAIRKFRAAIRLRFDFHRAVYNLGTVLYGLAEDTLRSGRKFSVRESAPSDLYSQSAIYIACAHALKPDYPVYQSALRLVRSMLPLPYLKAGYLTIPPLGNSLAPHSDWQRLWFVLDHEALYETEKIDRRSISRSMSRRPTATGVDSPSTSVPPVPRPSVLRTEMEDLEFMTPCADLSLPPGGGFRIDTRHGHHFLIADTWESMDNWVDAIRLVYTVFARGKRDALGGVLAG